MQDVVKGSTWGAITTTKGETNVGRATQMLQSTCPTHCKNVCDSSAVATRVDYTHTPVFLARYYTDKEPPNATKLHILPSIEKGNMLRMTVSSLTGVVGQGTRLGAMGHPKNKRLKRKETMIAIDTIVFFANLGAYAALATPDVVL